MTFNDAYNYADAVISLNFSNTLPDKNINWTSQDVQDLKSIETYALVMGFTPISRKMSMSKLFH